MKEDRKVYILRNTERQMPIKNRERDRERKR
jgi:hypothetical protein